MLYRLKTEPVAGNTPGGDSASRRFVLHRHHDEGGAHLDLRLEQDGYLMGFRVEGTRLSGEAWATVKPPHPMHWLDKHGDAVPEDGGTYDWTTGDARGGVLLLRGARGTVQVTVTPEPGLQAAEIAAVRAAAETLGVPLEDLAGLAEDGAAARERAVARYCGLGRELDGPAFNDPLWRNTLAGERLAVIQQYLHALEVRFDRKYPPAPVSVPVALDDDEDAVSTGRAMGILKGDG